LTVFLIRPVNQALKRVIYFTGRPKSQVMRSASLFCLRRFFSAALMGCILPGLALAGSFSELERRADEIQQNRNAVGQYDTAEILKRSRENSLPAGWLKRADAAQSAVQRAYDELAREEVRALLDHSQQVLAELRASGEIPAAEKAAIARLEEYAALYPKLLWLYGGTKDQVRRSAFAKYFQELQALNRRLTSVPLSATIRGKLTSVLRTARLVLAALPEVPAFLYRLYTVGKKEPVMAGKIFDLANGLTRRLGERVEVEGRELIPKLKHRKMINVYAPTHRNALNDLKIMAAIAPRDSLLFMAPRNFLPPILAGQLEGVPGLLAIKSGHKPAPLIEQMRALAKGPPPVSGPPSGKNVEYAIGEIERTGLQNIFIYPDGGLPAGVTENLGPRENFGPGLIKKLREKGFEVNLIPISYGDSARFMNRSPVGEKNLVLHARVHEPVPDQVLGRWENYDPSFVNRYVRAVHLDALETNGKQMMGITRPGELVKEMGAYLGSECSWLYGAFVK
jgi:hypothetical protein